MDPFTTSVGGGIIGTVAGGGQTSSAYGGGPGLITDNTVTGPVYPYSSSPGLQPGNAANGIQGVSYATPGRVERAVDAGLDFTPTRTNDAWEWAQPQMRDQGRGNQFVQFALGQSAPSVSSNTQGAYQWFQRNQPNLPQDAGLGQYYENAKRRALESVNQNAAARGAFGSSVAMDQGNEAITNLESERANREADYALQRANQIQNWGSAAASAASAADQTSLGAAGEKRAWTQGTGQLGLAADQANESRFNDVLSGANTVDQANATGTLTGLSAASTADAAARQRGQDALNATMNFGDAVSTTAGSAYAPMIQNDAALRDQFIALALGMPTEAFNADQTSQQNARTDANQFMDYLTWQKEMSAGGGGASPNAFQMFDQSMAGG